MKYIYLGRNFSTSTSIIELWEIANLSTFLLSLEIFQWGFKWNCSLKLVWIFQYPSWISIPFKTEDSTQFCYKHKLAVAELKNNLPCFVSSLSKVSPTEDEQFFMIPSLFIEGCALETCWDRVQILSLFMFAWMAFSWMQKYKSTLL